ncbi:hypothetical protein FKW77_009195 [Venturia effusa]|uniref:DNA (cytosine-5-)-methyltransferase n=1 Tax=Venturia effusa TaxID=50376 RepID=A0A517L424_9PEZI|nr:hypothetical protein FKW77_009195 [Venturia effusa]
MPRWQETVESSWGEASYDGSNSDTDSVTDSDLESTRTADLSDSEDEEQSQWSGSDSDLDLEEMQSELRYLKVPFQPSSMRKAPTKRRLQQTKSCKQNNRADEVIDLRSPSPSPTETVNISSDNEVESSAKDVTAGRRKLRQDRPRDRTQKLRQTGRVGTARTGDNKRKKIIVSSDEDDSGLEDTRHASRSPTSTSTAIDEDEPRSRGSNIPIIHRQPDQIVRWSIARARNKRHKTIVISSDEDNETTLEGGDPTTRSTRTNRDELPRGHSLNIPSSRRQSRVPHQSPHEATFLSQEDFVELNQYRFRDNDLKSGVTIERQGSSASNERSAFVIFRLLRHTRSRRVYVEGRRYVFTSSLPQVPGSPLGITNEVTAVLVECEADRRCVNDLERFPVDEVKRIWTLKLIAPSGLLPTSQDGSIAGELVCRLILVLRYKTRESWATNGTQVAGTLRPLKPEECNIDIHTHGDQHLFPGSSGKGEGYTFVDICASIGGASEAAKMAGMKITHAIERDTLRAAVYSLNFRDQETIIHTDDLLDLPPDLNISQREAAVLHCSMSCNWWSQAHTVSGKDDENNRALLHEIPKLIARIRPRQVTVEQVPGLIKMREHRGDWYKLMFAIAAAGYAFQWRTINFEELGGHAKRERLIMLASGPGEAMPPWPKSTHGAGPGLLPYITARKALSDLTAPRRPEPDGTQIPGRTVLCKPDELFSWTLVRNRHPTCRIDGYVYSILHWEDRPFTIQELARFQGLSQNREWAGSPTDRAKMIGDAVPPGPFSKILEQVVNTLKETDNGSESVSRSQYDEPFSLMPSTRSTLSRRRNEVSVSRTISPEPASTRRRRAISPAFSFPQKKRSINV